MSVDLVHLPDAPSIAGLAFRRFSGDADLDAMIAIHRSREQHDQVDPLSTEQRTPTVSELRDLFMGRADFDARSQLLMAEIDGSPIGYAWIRAWVQDPASWVCYHRTHLMPRWRGCGVGMAMLRWAEETLAHAVSFRPAGVHAILRTNVTDTERETVARLRRAGYRVANETVEMVLPALNALPEATVPEGFTIRAPQPSEYRALFEANADAMAQEWGQPAATEEDFEAWMSDERADPLLWRAAWHGDQVAGIVFCEISGPVGVVAELSVREPWRRRGLGRALLAAGLAALRERGAAQTRVFTDASDPSGARTLYQRVGFHEVKRYLRFVKPIDN